MGEKQMAVRFGERFLVAFAIVLLATAPLMAASTADAIRSRRDGLRELGAAFKNVIEELKSSTPRHLRKNIHWAHAVRGSSR